MLIRQGTTFHLNQSLKTILIDESTFSWTSTAIERPLIQSPEVIQNAQNIIINANVVLRLIDLRYDLYKQKVN